MNTRSNGLWTGFGWLKGAISMSYHHPKPLFGGAALLLLVGTLPSLITLPMQFGELRGGAPLSPTTFVWIMLGAMLLGLLIVPLYAGYLQLVHATAQGLPARARDIFKPYQQGEAWRLIGYGLAILVIYVVAIGIIVIATGSGVASWYMQVMTAQANHQLPPGLPQGFGIIMTLFMLIGLFMTGLYAISLGQIALRRRSVFEAISDGAIGALKNLLPLFVLMISVVLAWIVVAIAIVIVAILLSLLAKFVGLWLMFVVIVPLYIAIMLVMVTVMFGMMYRLWRDVCGDEIASGTAPELAA